MTITTTPTTAKENTMNATTTVGPYNPAAAALLITAASAASDAAELALAGSVGDPLDDADAMLLNDLRAAARDAYAAERDALDAYDREEAGLNAAYAAAVWA